MTRRVFPAALFAPVVAQTESRLLDLLAALAEALSTGNAPAFLNHVDKKMPGYERLRSHIFAIVAQYDIAASAEPLAEKDGAAEVDWYLELKIKSQPDRVERRRRILIMAYLDRKLIRLEPVDFFRPVLAP